MLFIEKHLPEPQTRRQPIFSYNPPVPSCPCGLQYAIQTPARADRTDVLAFGTLVKRRDAPLFAPGCAGAERYRRGKTSRDRHLRQAQNKRPVSCEVHSPKPPPSRQPQTPCSSNRTTPQACEQLRSHPEKPHEQLSGSPAGLELQSCSCFFSSRIKVTPPDHLTPRAFCYQRRRVRHQSLPVQRVRSCIQVYASRFLYPPERGAPGGPSPLP